MKGNDYYASDLFAVGAVFYELFYEREPEWRAHYVKDRRKEKICYQEFVTRLREATAARRDYLQKQKTEGSLPPKEQFEQLILRMVSEHPQERGTAQTLLQEVDEIIAKL